MTAYPLSEMILCLHTKIVLSRDLQCTQYGPQNKCQTFIQTNNTCRRFGSTVVRCLPRSWWWLVRCSMTTATTRFAPTLVGPQGRVGWGEYLTVFVLCKCASRLGCKLYRYCAYGLLLLIDFFFLQTCAAATI